MIYILACSLLFAVKGGQHGPVRKRIEDRFPFLHHVLDGKILSALGFGLITLNPLAALGWLIGCAPSIGEIIGAIGGYKGNWRGEGHVWGWKQGLQRGVFMGAMLALPLWNPLMIVAGALFPVAVWIGVSIEQYRTGKVQADWHIYEWIYGAVIGAFLAFA